MNGSAKFCLATKTLLVMQPALGFPGPSLKKVRVAYFLLANSEIRVNDKKKLLA